MIVLYTDRIRKLLLKNQNGALHAFHLLIQLNNEVIQLWTT